MTNPREVERHEDLRLTEPAPGFYAALLDDALPFELGIDWQVPADSLTAEGRLLRLAHVRAVLPANNAIEEQATHDLTLENYTRLALYCAGDRDILSTFLSYVGTVLEHSPDDARMLAQQVFWIWAPAAEIAGLRHQKEHLEDVAFQVLMPEAYDDIRQQYDRTVLTGENNPLDRMCERIEARLAEGLAPGVTFTTSARPKSNYSVWRKQQKEERCDTQIFDLVGIRIIIDIDESDEKAAVEQCYAAMAIVAGEYEPERARYKDYIREPKPNGYQSIHLVLHTPAGLPFELQIRTKRMHALASGDTLVSHQGYDATYKETPGKITRTYRKVPKLYSWRDEATQHIVTQGGSMEGLLGENLLFFRQDGNLYLLPSGATALDASFRIHSKFALTTNAIYRGGQLIAQDRPVRFGDVLTVLYSESPPTTFEQLDNLKRNVTTNRAIKAIEKRGREIIAEPLMERGRSIVREIVRRSLDHELADPFTYLDDKDQHQLAQRAGAPDFDSLLRIIGAGDRSGKPTRVARLILGRAGFGEQTASTFTHEALPNREVLKYVDIPTIGGESACRVAGCCTNMIAYGDEIVVRPSRVHGALSLHRGDCANVRDRKTAIVCGWHKR